MKLIAFKEEERPKLFAASELAPGDVVNHNIEGLKDALRFVTQDGLYNLEGEYMAGKEDEAKIYIRLTGTLTIEV